MPGVQQLLSLMRQTSLNESPVRYGQHCITPKAEKQPCIVACMASRQCLLMACLGACGTFQKRLCKHLEAFMSRYSRVPFAAFFWTEFCLQVPTHPKATGQEYHDVNWRLS